MGRPTLYLHRVEDIGPALVDLRKSQDVSQADVAEAMDMHRSHVGSYENGRVIPSGRKLIDFAVAHNYVVALVPRELAT